MSLMAATGIPASAILSNMVNMATTANSEDMEQVRRLAAQTARILQGPALAPHDEIHQTRSVLTAALVNKTGALNLAGALRELAGNHLVNGLMAADPELKARWEDSAVTLLHSLHETHTPDRARDLHEVAAIQTSLLATYRELQAAEALSYAPNYRGIRQYRQAVSGRIKDLDKIQKALSNGETLSGRMVERWERLRTAYLGEQENGYRSKFQQHLDLLKQAEGNPEWQYFDKKRDLAATERDLPLFQLMASRQEAYFRQIKFLAEQEKTDAMPIYLNALRDEKEILERSYHEAVEAYYFLKGYMPTTWRGSFGEMFREFQWTKPSTYISPILLGGLTTFIGASGVEPSTFDGTLYPAMNKRWENGTLVLESAHKTHVTGMSLRALGAGLLDTLRMQLALVNTSSIDPTGGNFEGFVPTWLHTVMGRMGITLRVEGLDNLKGLRNENLVIAPTHRGFIEYPVLLGLEDEFGHGFRIAAKDSFWSNPVIRALVGLAMKRYQFPFIDRSAGSDAVRGMEDMGRKLTTGKKSMATFPSMSRSPTLVFVFDGERVEGPHYKAKHGIGYLVQAGDDPAIIPVAIVGSGVMTPKSMSEQARGVPMGSTITMRIGKPFRASEVQTGSMDKDQISLAIAAKIDQSFRDLTGLPTGPLYRSGAKTIFQADDLAGLEKELRKRSKNLRHVAVVFPPSNHYRKAEESDIVALMNRLGLSKKSKLTVFHAVREGKDRYSFPAYDVVHTDTGFAVQRAG